MDNIDNLKRIGELKRIAADRWVAGNWLDILDHLDVEECLTDEEFAEYERLNEQA